MTEPDIIEPTSDPDDDTGAEVPDNVREDEVPDD